MNTEFEKRILRTKDLFLQLHNSPVVPLKPKLMPRVPAIYVFLENGEPVHVGRTRNLKNRSRGHITKNHYSASFAFKRARKASGNEKASYKSEGSRNSLVAADSPFLTEFIRQIELVKLMQVKFLHVEDPIDQYLLELYAAMEYRTCMTEFDTH
jgi:hypothetical protein